MRDHMRPMDSPARADLLSDRAVKEPFQFRPPDRYASHLEATRSGNLAKFTAMRRASSRVGSLSRSGRSYRRCTVVVIAVGIIVAGACVQLLLELDHIERRQRGLVRDIVVAPHDLAHLGLGRRPPYGLWYILQMQCR